MISFLPFGDSAVLINFEQSIHPEINSMVFAFVNALQSNPFPEVTFHIPAYCSLTIGFNKAQISYDEMVEKLKLLEEQSNDHPDTKRSRSFLIPVCYEDEFAPDMGDVEGFTGLSRKEIIARHSHTSYRIYMIGFLPGFPYMGILPEELHCERKKVPRLKVRTGSVGLAGSQTGIYPTEAPGGWQIIGRTPLQIFNVSAETPFLFRAGDQVKFKPVDKDEFETVLTDIEKNTFNWNLIYV